MNVRAKRDANQWLVFGLGLNKGSVFDLLRPGYLVAAVTGYVLLRLFTIRAAIPMPDADGSLVVLVAVCGLCCLLGLVWIAAIPLMPMWFVYDDTQLSYLLPAAQQGSLNVRRRLIYWERFLFVFAPYIAATMAFPFIVNVFLFNHPDASRDVQDYNRHLTMFLIESACGGIVVLLICQGLYRWTGQTFATQGTGRSGTLSFFMVSLVSLIFFWAWANALTMLGLSFALKTKFLPENSSPYFLILMYLGIVGWHCISTALVLWRHYQWALFWGILIYLFPILLYNGQLGALALRVTGMGGGI